MKEGIYKISRPIKHEVEKRKTDIDKRVLDIDIDEDEMNRRKEKYIKQLI